MNIDSYSNRHIRQEIFSPIGRRGQEKLRSSKAAVVGCGALGSRVSEELLRSGCGFLRIIDRDFIEISNLQRQVLFNEEDVKKGLPKAAAAKKHLQDIDSSARIEAVIDDLNYSTVEKYLSGVDIILDGTDNLETRMLINDYAQKMGIVYIYGAAVSSYGTTFNIIPGETACLRCLYPELPPPGEIDTCDTAGVISPVPGLIASAESAEALKFLTGNKKDMRASVFFADLWSNRFECYDILPSPDCICCSRGVYEYLSVERGKKITTLCGRNAVQITPETKEKLNFGEIEKKLKKVAEVRGNSFMLKFDVGDCEITVFKNGRAIFQGTSEENKAKSLYARFIGE